MMFKNLTLFRFSPAVASSLKDLDGALIHHRLRPCGPLEMFTRGFVPPVAIGEDAPLTRKVSHFTAFTAAGEDKIIPTAVVNEEVHRRIKQIAEEQGRSVGSRERKNIKEDAVTALLPRAFARTSRVGGYADTKNGWLVLDTSSRKAAEAATSQVRQALGSFPVVPLAPEEGPRGLMTDWLGRGDLPAGLTLGDECELRDPATANGSRWRGVGADLDSEEVKEHLRNGKQAFRLGLVFEDRIAFVLGEDLVLRKVKFLDGVLDEVGDTHEDAAAEADAKMVLMTAEFERLLGHLDEWFGLPRPADSVAP